MAVPYVQALTANRMKNNIIHIQHECYITIAHNIHNTADFSTHVYRTPRAVILRKWKVKNKIKTSYFIIFFFHFWSKSELENEIEIIK